MPIRVCEEGGQPGYKWGEKGKCYTYSPGDESSRKDAKKKAHIQGYAIEQNKSVSPVFGIIRGGPGSGHHGHGGRPGKLGGSLPGSGGSLASESKKGSEISQENWDAAFPQAEELLTNAKEVEGEVTESLKKLAAMFGGSLEGLHNRLKERDSLARKIALDMQKLGLDAETAAAKINDVLRYTLSFDPSSYAEAVQKVQETLRKDGWEKYDSKWKNFFVDDDMKYSGYHNIWVNGDGIRFELQYHTPESFKRKKLSHAAFKAFQATAPNSPERNQRYQDMIDAWEGFESPPGVENLEGIIP